MTIVRRNTLSLIWLFFISISCAAQSRTPNIGFEDGTFNHWELFSGFVGNTNDTINVSPATNLPGLFTIYGKEAAQEVDPYGNFPVRCPNGSNYSIRINDASTGKKAERISYTFQAPSSGPYSIIFNYAVVLEDFGHPDYDQPQFTARVFDVTDNVYIDCPSFNFKASSGLTGFQQAPDPRTKGTTIDYKPWSTATIDLRGYLGKTIRIEFTVNDCTLGGHFGYAYLDVEDSDSISPITGNSYCIGQNTVNLVGPTGFAQYDWYSADLQTKLYSGQHYAISPSPPDQTTYGLVIHPYDGLGCTDTLYTTINKINAGFVFKAPDTVYACTGKTFDLTNATIVAGSDAGLTYSYYTDPLGTVYAYNPDMLNDDGGGGQFYIKAINSEGCSGILPVYVKFGTPQLTITNPPAVQFPATVDITQTFKHSPNQTYSYFTDAGGTTPLANPTAVGRSGTYYVQVGDIHSCTSLCPIKVTVTPPDPFVLSAPTAFTPNGDGVNDLFKFSIEGYLDFGNVKIFNRNGQLLYMIKTIDQPWDGTYGGKQLPAGVYYWVFEGTDTYYKTPITKSGSITIIR